jgi:5-methylcytosine-specific restriction endonuclease McrA
MGKELKGSIKKTFLGTPRIKSPSTIILGLPDHPKKKDIRRSFSPTQKKEILYQQDHKCARCHKKLDPRATHFHHEKPWSSGGRTKTANGRALCASCHEILSHKERLKRVDKKKRRTSFP